MSLWMTPLLWQASTVSTTWTKWDSLTIFSRMRRKIFWKYFGSRSSHCSCESASFCRIFIFWLLPSSAETLNELEQKSLHLLRLYCKLNDRNGRNFAPELLWNYFQSGMSQINYLFFSCTAALQPSSGCCRNRKLSHLTEKVSRKLFLENSLFCDKIKQILAGLGALHHDDEAVVPLEKVQELDHAVHGSNSLHEADLQRNPVQSDLKGYMEIKLLCFASTFNIIFCAKL